MFDIFIKRPVLASVVSLLILFLGLRSLSLLPVRQYPEMSNTVITVTTTFPGADGVLMQGFVTDPLQKAVATARGIDYVTSASSEGKSEIKVHVKLNEDPNAAMTEVSAKVAEVRSALPRDIDDPVIQKSTGETFATAYVAYFSDRHDTQQITDYVTRVIQPKLMSVAGVADPRIFGGQKFSMRVWLDPDKLAQYGLSVGEIRQALTANNYLSAAGSAKGAFDVVGTTANTDLKSVDEFRRLVVRGQGAHLVRLGDVAQVALGSENSDASVFVNGQKAVFIGIYTTPDANPLTVMTDVRALLPSMADALPPGMGQKLAYDKTVFINASIDEVVKTIAEAALIVMVVIYLFMGSVRSVVIPVVTVPLSLIGVCLFLMALGFSINLLTLLAMVLAIGLVVDDAIVVVENVHRHIEEGETPFQAALVGTREIAGPVISMTITLAAVYAPIAFMGGLTGTLFKEFALTLAGAVVISGIIALTLSPMMCSKILRHDGDPQGFAARVDKVFSAVQAGYLRWLRASLADRPTTLAFGVIVLVSLPFMFLAVPGELAPEEDQGVVFVSVAGPANANLDYLEAFTNRLAGSLAELPESSSTFAINGFPSANGGFGATVLHPWGARERSQKDLTPEVQARIDAIAGVKGSAFGMPSLPGADGLPVQFVFASTLDYVTLAELTEKMMAAAVKSGLFAFVDADLKFEKPQTVIRIDRDKAAAYGVTMSQVGETLSTLTSGNYVNLINLDGRSYKVIPQVPRAARFDPQTLGRFHVKTADGALVPLSGLITMEPSVQPVALNQFNQLNAVTIQAFPMPGVSLGTALDALKDSADAILPPGTTIDHGGQSRQYVQEGNALALTFVFALVVIFLVLAAQFESFRDPLVILVSVPLSVCGALIPLALGVASMNIYTQVGLVTLIGLITKHGILICEVARERQEQDGLTRIEAVIAAAGLRLRPILMTTAAMVAGLIPLMFADGAGAASRHAISWVIVAGMSVGTLFTLFVLPTIYSFLAKERREAEEPAVDQVSA